MSKESTTYIQSSGESGEIVNCAKNLSDNSEVCQPVVFAVLPGIVSLDRLGPEIIFIGTRVCLPLILAQHAQFRRKNAGPRGPKLSIALYDCCC